MKILSPHDVVGNCRMAFDAAECLGIPRVIEPTDMSLLAVPDKLAVMTYLYQLRAHFTGHQLQVQQIGNTSDESSYIIGNYATDNNSETLLTFDHLKKHFTQQLDDDADDRSPLDRKDAKHLILSSSKYLLNKVLSPAKDKLSLSSPGNKPQMNGVPQSQIVTSPVSDWNDPLGVEIGEHQVYDPETQRNGNASNRSESPMSPISPASLDPSTANVSVTKLHLFRVQPFQERFLFPHI